MAHAHAHTHTHKHTHAQVSMPPQFWALDVRKVAPYSLPMVSKQEGDLDAFAEERLGVGQPGTTAGSPSMSGVATSWQQSTAARRVYGPVPPPPQ